MRLVSLITWFGSIFIFSNSIDNEVKLVPLDVQLANNFVEVHRLEQLRSDDVSEIGTTL